MGISKEQVREVRERADIVEVIGRRVALKQRGKRYLGLCPFHGEKTPSFSVSPEKGLYYCFGCHASGDVFTFVKEIEGLDFYGAVRSLAKEVGVQLSPESPQEEALRKETQAVARANEFAHAYFKAQLWGGGGTAARAYLEERGIPKGQTEKRALGFGGPPGGLVDYLAAKKVPKELSEKAGLFSDSSHSLFEGRLIFPILDTQGRLAGFGGRRIGEGAGPKYINTREGALFSKRQLLYGWEVAQDAIRRKKRAIVVEGYTDVLALQRAEHGEAVASLGTAFTDEHAQLLKRFADEVVLILDGDRSGANASREATEKLLRAELKVSVVELPNGEDPDTFVRGRSLDEIRRAVETRRPALEVQIERAFAGVDGTIEGRSEAATRLSGLMLAMRPGLQRDLYAARLAERVGVSVEQLERHLRRNRPKAPSPTRSPGEPAEPPGSEPAKPSISSQKPQVLGDADVSILRNLLLYPQLWSSLAELSEYATEPLASVLDGLAEGADGDDFELAEGLGRLIPDERSRVQLLKVRPYSGDDVENRAKTTFEGLRGALQARYLDATLQDVRRTRSYAHAAGEDTTDLDQQIRDLTRTVRRLKRPN